MEGRLRGRRGRTAARQQSQLLGTSRRLPPSPAAPTNSQAVPAQDAPHAQPLQKESSKKVGIAQQRKGFLTKRFDLVTNQAGGAHGKGSVIATKAVETRGEGSGAALTGP